MKRYKQLLTAGVAISILGVLAGCGQSTGSNITNNTVMAPNPNSSMPNSNVTNTTNTVSSNTGLSSVTYETQSVTIEPGVTATFQVPVGWSKQSVAAGDTGGFKWTNPSNSSEWVVVYFSGNVAAAQDSTGHYDVTQYVNTQGITWTTTSSDKLSGQYMIPKGAINNKAAGYGYAKIITQPSPIGLEVMSMAPKSIATTVTGSVRVQLTTSQSTGFKQTFKNDGGTNDMYLTPSIGFQVTNLGGGASNFEYQFSKTTDGGKTWTKLSTGHYSDVRGVSFIDQQTGYLLNNSPAYSITPDLFVTYDGGITWKEQKLPIPSAYTNDYRASNYPVFFSQQVGFIPVYGEGKNNSSTRFLYMLVTTNGGSSWTSYTGNQGGGLSWTLNGDKLTVTQGTQTITVNGLFGNWRISP